MVYIKLAANLYSRVKNLIEPDKLVLCQKQIYVPYPEFKRIAVKHNLEIHRQIGRHDIVTYNDMELMIEKEKQSPEQAKLIEELKNKSELRRLKLINSKGSDDFYFQKKAGQSGIKEMTQTISYSMAFIFSFFMAGLTGYYVGHYFLNWEFIHSMILALAFIFVTIIVETTLFILRQISLQSRSKKKPSDAIPKANQRTLFSNKSEKDKTQ